MAFMPTLVGRAAMVEWGQWVSVYAVWPLNEDLSSLTLLFDLRREMIFVYNENQSHQVRGCERGMSGKIQDNWLFLCQCRRCPGQTD